MAGWKSKSLIILCLVISLDTLISVDLLLPVYLKSIGGSMILIGGVYSLDGLVGLLIRIPSGIFSDKIGKKPVLMIGEVLKSLGAFILSLSKNVNQVISSQLFRSSGLAIEEPTFLALISEKSEIVK